MHQPQLKLYFAPDSCARVPLIALEEIGCQYDLEVVSFVKQQQRTPEYLALSPGGKVPVLTVDGAPLTENVAILSWLAVSFPSAELLPKPANAFSTARVLSDLAFCASVLHPIVTRLRVPQYTCDQREGAKRVFEMAEAAMHPNFAYLDGRLQAGEWWYGDAWSILDAYINWVWFRVSGTAFKADRYTHLARHDEAMKRRPAVQRALRISAEVAESLASQGLAVILDGDDAIQAPLR